MCASLRCSLISAASVTTCTSQLETDDQTALLLESPIWNLGSARNSRKSWQTCEARSFISSHLHTTEANLVQPGGSWLLGPRRDGFALVAALSRRPPTPELRD
jgi:hypothetical protein